MITTENFNKKLAGFVKSAKAQRDRVQELLEFGMNRAADDHCDVSYLNRLFDAAVDLKSVPVQSLNIYVAYVTDGTIKYSKTEKGNFTWRKAKKGIEVTVDAAKLEVKWYEYTQALQAPKELKFDAFVKSVLTRIDKAEKEGGLDNPEKFAELRSALGNYKAAA